MFHTTESDLKMDAEKLPSWITALEDELVKAVNEHE
jgi:hypothetical protein